MCSPRQWRSGLNAKNTIDDEKPPAVSHRGCSIYLSTVSVEETNLSTPSLRRNEHIHLGDVPRQIEDVLP